MITCYKSFFETPPSFREIDNPQIEWHYSWEKKIEIHTNKLQFYLEEKSYLLAEEHE